MRVDGTGRFLIPGFWDMHSHHQMTGTESLDLYLANGVVGTRDMGSDVDYILPLRDRINRGEVFGPEIVAAGPILDDRPRPTRPVPTLRRQRSGGAGGGQGSEGARRRLHQGARHTPREAFLAIAEEATRARTDVRRACAECRDGREAADAGIKSIEHLANFRVFSDCSEA